MTASSAVTEPTTHRLDALTGLRFLAAAAVAIEHFPQMIPGLGLEPAAQGGAGVALFFVLSGFVLMYNYAPTFETGWSRRTLERFGFARLARLFPLHLAALALVAGLVVALRNPFDEHSVPVVAVGLIANVLLLHAWVPAQAFNLWNGPTWSISNEIFFYAVFPFAVSAFAVPLARRRWLGRAIVVVIVIETAVFIVGAVLVGSLLLRRGHDVDGTRLLVSRLGNVPALRVGEFLVGCLLGAAFNSEHRLGATGAWRRLESRGVRTTLIGLCALVLVAIQLTPTCPASSCYPDAQTARSMVDLRLFVVYLPVVTVLVAAVAWGRSWFADLLSLPAMVRLGEISYAFYLLQWAAWLMINDAAQPPSQSRALLAVMITLLAAWAAHRWIERPARAGLVDWLARRPRADTGPGPNAG